ncbi:MAG: flagellar basal body P-ring formation chaperone FlgA [Pseudomonadota bacterium]
MGAYWRKTLLLLAALGAGTSLAHAQIQVQGPWITLGDLAPIGGSAGGTPVAPAPAPGQSLALDPDYVSRIALDAGVAASFGAAPIWVVRAPVAPTAPKAATAPTPRQAVPAQSAYRPPVAAAPPSSPAIDPFDDFAPEPGYVLVFARDMKRGDIVAVSDLEWIAPDASLRGGASSAGAPERMSDVVGQELRRSYRAGRAFRTSDVRTPAAIKKGEPVTLTYTSAGLRLSVEGKALSDAMPGASLRVMNLYSKRSVEAVAVAPGEARVFQR